MGELYEVERFEGARTLRNGIGEREFLVKWNWKGWGADEMTYRPWGDDRVCTCTAVR